MADWLTEYVRQKRQAAHEEENRGPYVWEGRSPADLIYGRNGNQYLTIYQGTDPKYSADSSLVAMTNNDAAGPVGNEKTSSEVAPEKSGGTPGGKGGGDNSSAPDAGNPENRQNPTTEPNSVGGNDYNLKEIAKAADKAPGWKGTPYAGYGSTLAGKNFAKGKGADCSGAIKGIYDEAGLGFDYQPTATFDKSPSFRQLGPNEAPSRGDLGVVRGRPTPDSPVGGHMVIFDPTAKDNNGNPANSWSAQTHGFQGRNYEKFEEYYGGNKMKWYRRIKP